MSLKLSDTGVYEPQIRARLGRCQNSAWKKHKKSCISPAARKARVIETVKVKMAAANRAGDFEAVIVLGQQAEKVNHFLMSEVIRRKLTGVPRS